MNVAGHNRLVSFIWSIADDHLRDVYVRGKYRDVILPMVVLRRLDALLEKTKAAVLEEVRFQREDAKFAVLDKQGLMDASGYVFYNTSKWTMERLKATTSNNSDLLLANFHEYLDGFSENVAEIIEKFKLRTQISHMHTKGVLLGVLEKFTSRYINLTPDEVNDPDGRALPPLSNLGMGYVFEELVRRFNEENNEEAGEHFTPREVINLMTHLVIRPDETGLPPVITIYDPACGSGGMLTEAQNFILDPEGEIRSDSQVLLYGVEINDETYAICKSDMMIKGNSPENIKCGSTLSENWFSDMTFDFMLSNPPYGKSWSGEEKHILDGKVVTDHRFMVQQADYWGRVQAEDTLPRTSDGQLLFLMDMVRKMKPETVSPFGSRIASVHNGSSLFTGDAGGGESNARRYIIENDLLEAIIQLPNNLFYNTGITTYIWLLNNRKAPHRRGKVQLIDASGQYSKLRKNLGNKNCELAPEHIAAIQTAYAHMQALEPQQEGDLASKIFDNTDFGYYKVTIERPKRLKAQFSQERIATLRYHKSLVAPMTWAYEAYGERIYADLEQLEQPLLDWCEKQGVELTNKTRARLLGRDNWQEQRHLLDVATLLMEAVGTDEHRDFNVFRQLVAQALKARRIKLKPAQLNQILDAVSWYDETAEKVIDKVHKLDEFELSSLLEHLGCQQDELPHFGYYPTGKANEFLTYETETDLRDTENIPLKENILAYYLREVHPYVPEAWIDLDSVKIGYEISFNRYFYRHKPLRSLQAVSAEILALEQETDGLLKTILQL